MVKSLLITTTMLAMLSGCVGHPPMFRKPAFNVQQYHADFAQCVAQARSSSAAAGYTNDMMQFADMVSQRDMCMSGKGYTRLQ